MWSFVNNGGCELTAKSFCEAAFTALEEVLEGILVQKGYSMYF